jgi:diadenosine tetraphosphate (Ap4A) HIT family hydrolase
MTKKPREPNHGCVFCAITAGAGEASMVYEDDTVVAFMDLDPVTPGHLLVVPRMHVIGLEDIDPVTSGHVWTIAHELALAVRRSDIRCEGARCEGINLLLCDGEVAFQTVPHFHLHVIPRYPGDGWTIIPDTATRERLLLDSDAQAIRDAIASTP